MMARDARGGGNTSTPTRGGPTSLPLLRSLLLFRRSLSWRRAQPASASRDDDHHAAPGRDQSKTGGSALPWRRRARGGGAVRVGCFGGSGDQQQEQPLPLDDAHLSRYLDRHCPDASLVPRDSLTEADERDHVVKSIVLSAKFPGGAPPLPVLAVLRLSDRLDERAVAAHLGLSRRAVRLSTTDEALAWSGYVVGTVPPCGHARPLRTLVDVAVTRAGKRQDAGGGEDGGGGGGGGGGGNSGVGGPETAVVFGGGGRDGVEMRVPMAALLRASCAEVGAFAAAAPKKGGEAGAAASGGSSSEDEGGGRVVVGAAGDSNGKSSGALPLPWAPGSEFVRIVAAVGARRRVARLLMFATLVPDEQEQAEGGGGGLAGRQQKPSGKHQKGGPKRPPRPWARPAQSDGGGGAGGGVDAVEVQVIAGKTLERRLGAEPLARLLASVRPGCVVAVTGRVAPPQQQQQQRPRDAEGEGDNVGAAANASPCSATTLDLVACEVEVLFASRPERDTALRAAEASAGLPPGALRSARELLALRRAVAEAGEVQGAAAFARAWLGRDDQGSSLLSSSSSSSSEPAAATADAPAGDRPTDDDAAPLTRKEYYRMPLDETAVSLVVDLAGLEACASALRDAEGEQRRRWASERAGLAGGEEADERQRPAVIGSRFLLSDRAAVVGIDAEWPPYGSNGGGDESSSDGQQQQQQQQQQRQQQQQQRQRPPSSGRPPVSLLQLALRDRVFLLDLPALLPLLLPSPPYPSPPPLTPAEQLLDATLTHLMASPWLVKAGFGLEHDLRRLAESYPRLPCFAPAAFAPADGAAAALDNAPVRGHVDLPLLARAVLPALAYKAPAAAGALGPVPSLSRLCEAALGAPLDKREQRSAWAARPLSAAQVAYAAADARVLVSLFDSLVARQHGFGLEGAATPGRGAEDDGGAAAAAAAIRALDGGLRRVPRAKAEGLSDGPAGGKSAARARRAQRAKEQQQQRASRAVVAAAAGG